MHKVVPGCNVHSWMLRERGPWGARQTTRHQAVSPMRAQSCEREPAKSATRRSHPSVLPIRRRRERMRLARGAQANLSRSESAGAVKPTSGRVRTQPERAWRPGAKRWRSRHPPPISGGFGTGRAPSPARFTARNSQEEDRGRIDGRRYTICSSGCKPSKSKRRRRDRI